MIDDSKRSFIYVVVDCHDGHILVLGFGVVKKKKKKKKKVKNVLSLSNTVLRVLNRKR